MTSTQCLYYDLIIPMTRLGWQFLLLQIYTTKWFNALRHRNSTVGSNSTWWHFVYQYPLVINQWLKNFILGDYQFSPMQRLYFPEEIITIWNYSDRLILFLLLKIIQPTFKHIIAAQCLHLGGPNQVKPALMQVKNAFRHGSLKPKSKL
jgi:hypothetical protein